MYNVENNIGESYKCRLTSCSSSNPCTVGQCYSGYCCEETYGADDGICPNQQQAIGSCENGQCGMGYTCVDGLCCSRRSREIRCLDGSISPFACLGGRCGPGYQCSIGNICCPESTVCLPGETAIGVCVDGQCPNGYTCRGSEANAVCCSGTDALVPAGPCTNGICPGSLTCIDGICYGTPICLASETLGACSNGFCASGYECDFTQNFPAGLCCLTNIGEGPGAGFTTTPFPGLTTDPTGNTGSTASPITPNPVTPGGPCIPGDITFVVDESGSVQANNFQTMLGQLQSAVSVLDIGTADSQSHVGMVTFSDKLRRPNRPAARLQFMLGTNLDQTSLQTDIGNTPYLGGGTNIASGMNLAMDDVFGQNGDRPTIKNIMIVLTDGQDMTGSNIVAAQMRAAAEGITTYAIGIGTGTDYNQIVNIAGTTGRAYDNIAFNMINAIIRQIYAQEGICLTMNYRSIRRKNTPGPSVFYSTPRPLIYEVMNSKNQEGYGVTAFLKNPIFTTPMPRYEADKVGKVWYLKPNIKLLKSSRKYHENQESTTETAMILPPIGAREHYEIVEASNNLANRSFMGEISDIPTVFIPKIHRILEQHSRKIQQIDQRLKELFVDDEKDL